MNRNSYNLFKTALPYIALVIFIVALDQTVKLLAYYKMDPGNAGEIRIIGDFFKLHLVQNPGMAFGIKWDSAYGKLILTIGRLCVTLILFWYFIISFKKGASKLLLFSLSLIIAGAIGNDIDSIYYGILLDNALPGSPTPWFHGQVVDMFYFDIWQGKVSESVPLIGGRYLSLWPIFNVADAVISIGVIIIIVFQGRIFDKPKKEIKEK